MSLGACLPDVEGDPPAVVWMGEHVEVRSELDLTTWCPGTLPRLDGQVGALKDLFAAPEELVISYQLHPPPLSGDLCAEGFLACYNKGSVFSSDLLDTHEIVHAISASRRKLPHFFEEGAASYWGYHYPADFRGLDIREVLDKHWWSGMGPPEYALAAHFTSYLIHTHGVDRYRALLGETWRGQTRTEFESSFIHALGVSLDETIDNYEEKRPFCDVDSTQRRFYECSQPAIKLIPGEWSTFAIDISCSDPEVVGPSPLGAGDGLPRIWRDITIDLETYIQDLTFEVPEAGEPNSVVMDVRRCDTYCADVMTYNWHLTPDNEIYPNEYNLYALPGRYVVRISRTADDPGPVRFVWRSH